jgi:hypothetical protein
MFVARDEHEEAKILVCPLPGCNHAWCKQCQQSIEMNGPKHSCDGTSELDHLMKQQGWKYCPCKPAPAISILWALIFSSSLACKTPIQKVSGCNHMSVRCDLDFSRSALYLTPTSTVYDSCVQHVSRIFVFVIAMSDRERFNQALLLHLRQSHREIGSTPRDKGGSIGAL